jgi:serine/threonine-protein kinase
LYYVMPYIEGESLRDRLNRETQLPVEDAVRIASQVAAALEHAHSHNVIHRDIKPENILLSAGEAVVADFGIARAVSAAGGEQLTETGMAVGTPAYMSPEQATAEDVDGRTDIYSLGCVLYEMLGGDPPYTGPTPKVVLARKLTDPVPSLKALRRVVSDELESVVVKALNRDPVDRFPSAAAFADGLKTPSSIPAVRTELTRTRGQLVAYAAVVAVVLLGVVWLLPKVLGPAPAEAVAELPRLVVLPFENLGAPEDEYFADGIMDEITARLAGLDSLSVISRQSAIQYKNTDKTPQQIGEELDVGFLLEGTIRWQHSPDGSSRVRVTPQLIRVADDIHLWAEIYDQPLTEVFAVQSEIAEQVVDAMGVALGGEKREPLVEQLTENLVAYEHYLRGNAAFNEGFPLGPAIERAVEQYEIVVQLDPGFALAYAKLSLAHFGMFQRQRLPTLDRLALAEETALEALRLDPDLPEGHAALGVYHYACCRDYDRAHAELELALAQRPNDAFLLSLSAMPYKRSGNLERAAALCGLASDLNPMAWSPATEANIVYSALRNYDRAERYQERYAALAELAPGSVGVSGYRGRAVLAFKRDGDGDAAREFLEQAQQRFGDDYWRLVVDVGARSPPLARVLCAQDTAACHQALKQISDPLYGSAGFWFYLTMAGLYDVAEDENLSRSYYDSAATAVARWRDVVPLTGPGAEFREQSVTYVSEGALAVIAAGFGDAATATRHLELRLEVQPRVTDRFMVMVNDDWTAQAYVMTGEHEAALEELEFRLSTPSILSVPQLRVDPLYEPLRYDPRFQALLERYGN